MSEEQIRKAESALESATGISSDKKSELLTLLSNLKSALGSASQTHYEAAQGVARLAGASAREATRPDKKPELLGAALDRLKQSVKKFEATHPDLVITVNGFATALAEMGL